MQKLVQTVLALAALSVAGAQESHTTQAVYPLRQGYIQDHAMLFSSSETQLFEESLMSLDKDTGTAVVILTVPHLGVTEAEYIESIRCAWHLNEHPSVLLLVVQHDGLFSITSFGKPPFGEIEMTNAKNAMEPLANRQQFAEALRAGYLSLRESLVNLTKKTRLENKKPTPEPVSNSPVSPLRPPAVDPFNYGVALGVAMGLGFGMVLAMFIYPIFTWKPRKAAVVVAEEEKSPLPKPHDEEMARLADAKGEAKAKTIRRAPKKPMVPVPKTRGRDVMPRASKPVVTALKTTETVRTETTEVVSPTSTVTTEAVRSLYEGVRRKGASLDDALEGAKKDIACLHSVTTLIPAHYAAQIEKLLPTDEKLQATDEKFDNAKTAFIEDRFVDAWRLLRECDEEYGKYFMACNEIHTRVTELVAKFPPEKDPAEEEVNEKE